MLNRFELAKFENYLNDVIDKRDTDNAYLMVFKFLDSVMIEFYATSTKFPSEEIQKLHNAKTNHWSKYHRLQQKLNILAKLYQNPEDKKKLEQAFTTAYEYNFKKLVRTFAKAYEAKAKKSQKLKERSYVGQASLEEITFTLSRVFAGGIAEGILNNFNQFPLSAPNPEVQRPEVQNPELMNSMAAVPPSFASMDASLVGRVAEAFDTVREGKFSQFTQKAIENISKLTTEIDAINDELSALPKSSLLSLSPSSLMDDTNERKRKKLEAKKANCKLLLNSFKIAASEAINLIHQEAKMADSFNGNYDVLSSVDAQFKRYIIKHLTPFLDRDHQSIFEKNHPELYKIAYIECDNAIKDLRDLIEDGNLSAKELKRAELKLKKAISLKRNLLKFCQPNVVASDFGVLNPAFLINPQSLRYNAQYNNLCDHLAKELTKVKVDVIKDDFNTFPKQKTIWGQIRDKITSRTAADDESEESTQEIARYTHTFLKEFKVNNIQDFTKLAYGLNQAVFNERNLRNVKINRSPEIKGKAGHLDEAGIYSNQDSSVRQLVVNKMSILRGYVNQNADMIKTLIGRGDQNLNIHDLYFELNLSTNVRIKETAKSNYNNVVNGFPRNLLNFFSDPGLKSKREEKLNKIMNLLVASKTEEDYIKFFVAANNLLVNYKEDGNLRWDSLFKETIHDAMLSVIRNHVLYGENRFKLNFSTEQLEHIFKYLKANHVDAENKTYKALVTLIKERKLTEAKLPDELKTSNVNQNLEAGAQDQHNKSQDEVNTAKVEKFRIILMSKLESNMLADMVISTGRVQINDRDIGLVVKKLSLVLSTISGASADFIADHASAHDKRKQTAESEEMTKLIAKCGGTQMMFNEIVSSAVSELCSMFESAIKNMYDEEEVAKVAEVFFIRMYAALNMTDDEKEKKKLDNLSIRDLLIESVFRIRKDSSWNPFRKVHYRTVGDDSLFPNTTVQGLIDGVSIYSEEETIEIPASPEIERKASLLSPPAPEALAGSLSLEEPLARLSRLEEIDKAQQDREPIDKEPQVRIEPIEQVQQVLQAQPAQPAQQAQQAQQAQREPIEQRDEESPREKSLSTTTITQMYLRPGVLTKNSPDEKSQMQKYKFCRASNKIAKDLAMDLRRIPYDPENQTLGGERISDEDAATIKQCLEATRNGGRSR